MSAATLLSRPQSAARRRPFVEAADGTRLAWFEWGKGPPLLFLHSWAMATQMWDYEFARFADAGYRAIGFDRRGHGRSDIPAGGYDFDTFADDLAAVIEALNLKDVTLVGHSMGCNEIARHLARHGDRRVARVVFLAPVTPFLRQTEDNPAGVPEEAWEAMRAAWASDFPKWLEDNAPGFFVPETSAALMRWGVDMLARTPLPVVIACNRALTAEDFRSDVAAMNVPTLILHGDADLSAPLALTGQPTAALIKRSQLKVYEGAPHGLMYTHRDRMHEDMLAFMKS